MIIYVQTILEPNTIEIHDVKHDVHRDTLGKISGFPAAKTPKRAGFGRWVVLPQVPVHIEMSFRDSPPATQLFYAQQVDQWKGGETPLSFGRWKSVV